MKKKVEFQDLLVMSNQHWLMATIFLFSLPVVALVATVYTNYFLGAEMHKWFGSELFGFWFLPILLLLIGEGINSIAHRHDYLLFTSRGIDMNICPKSHPFAVAEKRVIAWDQVEQWALVKERGFGRFQQTSFVLLLKFAGEAETWQFEIGPLESFQQQVDAYLCRYAPKTGKRSSELIEKNERGVTVGDCFAFAIWMSGGLVSTLDIFEHTFVSPYFWFLVIVACLLIAIPLKRISRLKVTTHYFMAFALSFWVCWGILAMNAQDVVSETELTVCKYPVVHTSFEEERRGRNHEPAHYHVIIDADGVYRNIEFSNQWDERILKAKSIEFEVYRGKLGLDVWRNLKVKI